MGRDENCDHEIGRLYYGSYTLSHFSIPLLLYDLPPDFPLVKVKVCTQHMVCIHSPSHTKKMYLRKKGLSYITT